MERKILRKIIHINQEKCNGCAACVTACHEGALVMQHGKATLVRDDYCDGLGDCLPTCPTGALSFEEREADAYDDVAVQANIQKQSEQGKQSGQDKQSGQSGQAKPFPCQGSHVRTFSPASNQIIAQSDNQTSGQIDNQAISTEHGSQLTQWPIQIKLVPVNAPYFNEAHLLLAADCTAYAYGDFHNQFMKGKITLIGCPKLDEGDYATTLTEIFRANTIKSIVLFRMQVPCCGGMHHALSRAIEASGKSIPWQSIVISPDGRIVDEKLL